MWTILPLSYLFNFRFETNRWRAAFNHQRHHKQRVVKHNTATGLNNILTTKSNPSTGYFGQNFTSLCYFWHENLGGVETGYIYVQYVKGIYPNLSAHTTFIEIYMLTRHACTNIPLSSARLPTFFQQPQNLSKFLFCPISTRRRR